MLCWRSKYHRQFNKISIPDEDQASGGRGGMYVEFIYCPPGQYHENHCDNSYYVRTVRTSFHIQGL